MKHVINNAMDNIMDKTKIFVLIVSSEAICSHYWVTWSSAPEFQCVATRFCCVTLRLQKPVILDGGGSSGDGGV
jgi:hypothetical protein